MFRDDLDVEGVDCRGDGGLRGTFEDVEPLLDLYRKQKRSGVMLPMPRSLCCQRTDSLEGETDVDNDGDAVGQRKVIAEVALHYVEVLTLVHEDLEGWHHRQWKLLWPRRPSMWLSLRRFG